MKVNMNGSFLTINDFDFPKTIINEVEIRRFTSEDGFMQLGVELLKEIATISSTLSCAYKLDEHHNPRKWTRNEAILGGLMIRIVKLQSGLLDQICQQRLELAFIISRCLNESLINLEYLLEKDSDEAYNEFIEYSLREEKRLLNRINNNIKLRGSELPIERRMKESIEGVFKTSQFKIEDVHEENKTPWGQTIYRRAEKIGLQDAFFALFSLPSHFVHGNWQDLISHHLEHKDGEFSPSPEWKRPRPQILSSTIVVCARVNKLYLNKTLPLCADSKQIQELIDDILIRTKKLDDLHEEYLQQRK